jgi:transcription termination factor nusA
MNKELLEALDVLEKEKNISKEVLIEAIENSLLSACKNNYGTSDNVQVIIDPQTCDYQVLQEKEVVEEYESNTNEEKALKISLEEAREIDADYSIGDKVLIPLKSKNFGRIATLVAKNVILQKIREEERKAIYNEYFKKEKDIVTGTVQRYIGNNISINLGRCDAMLLEKEQVKSEHLEPTDRIKVYILEVKEPVKGPNKGPRITVSRTHPDLVKRLFETEVAEIKEGTVEIMSIAREPGSRTKMAVISHNEAVDAVGACVGINSSRVNAVVAELKGEKIDIINWTENAAALIENALNPAKVICVVADESKKEAQVIVPDYQLSLAIGKEGQNARLAARLTGYKIDIKDETSAIKSGLFDQIGIDYMPEGESDREQVPFDDIESYDISSEITDIKDKELSEEAAKDFYTTSEVSESCIKNNEDTDN